MKFYCRYHPITVARWHCKKCRLGFCTDCIPAADHALKMAKCPHCQDALGYLKERKTEQPFWQEHQRFYRFPLQREPMLLILLTGLFSLAALLNDIAAFGVLALNLLLLHRYAHASVIDFARGRFQAPGLQVLLNRESFTGTFALLLANVVLVGPGVLCAVRGLRAAAAVVSILALLIAPALLISVLRQQDFRAALNPASLLAPIVRMDKEYWLLSAYLALCLLLGLIVTDVFLQHAPPVLWYPAFTVIPAYLMLALAALFGYVLCQYDAFDVAAEGDTVKSRKPKAELNTLITNTHIDMALKDGELDKVITLLRTSMKQKKASDLRRDQLYFLLRQRKDYAALAENAEAYLWRLLIRSQYKEALHLLKALQTLDPAFCLHDLELSFQLAEHCSAQEEYRLLLWLARDGHKRFKAEPALARLYTLAADTLENHFGEGKKAALFRDFVQAHLSPSQDAG